MITKKTRRLRRAVKTRARIHALGVARLTVHRTPRHIYAQLTDASVPGCWRRPRLCRRPSARA